MNLKQLEAFVKIADSGSFSQAAKELFLTQPTISAHISALEKELDARVFVRNTKEVRLSQDGEVLYQYARQMVELQRTIEDYFIAREDRDRGSITIAASSVPAQYLLPNILVRFNELYPNQQFKVTETDSAKVVELVANHMADVGFTGTVFEKKSCKYIPFYRDELVIIAPNTEKYRCIRDSMENLKWIEKEFMIIREEGSGTRREAERLLHRNGVELKNIQIVGCMDNQEMIKRFVQNGVGISIISRLAAKEEMENGELLGFPLSAEDSGRDINVIYSRNFRLTESAEKLIKVVREVYRP